MPVFQRALVAGGKVVNMRRWVPNDLKKRFMFAYVRVLLACSLPAPDRTLLVSRPAEGLSRSLIPYSRVLQCVETSPPASHAVNTDADHP